MIASQISLAFKPSSCTLPCPDAPIHAILTDSRRLSSPSDTLFFAIPTPRNNGARYVKELYHKGVRNFVVANDLPDDLSLCFQSLSNDANFWFVPNVVAALQRLVAYHRAQFHIPVVGITGSNGKTIVKEWLLQLLSSDHCIAANPKSYNSQIGVPLSVWQLSSQHDMAIFEAGISQPDEMSRLQNVIQPSIGIFTNIGQAHDENFVSRQQKIAEKLQLFTHSDLLIYCADHKDIHSLVVERLNNPSISRYLWGSSPDVQVRLLSRQVVGQSTRLSISHLGASPFSVSIPFVDSASTENAMHCITLLLFLGYPPDVVARRCASLHPVEMRLEINEGINNCLLVNDSYSLDINSLSIALDFIYHNQTYHRKTLVISDFIQSGIPEDDLYRQVASLVRQRGVTRLIGVGPALSRSSALFHGIDTLFVPDTDAFLQQVDFASLHSEIILLKGARCFGFERIAKFLRRRSHETVMEVNIDALVHNLNFFRSRIAPSTKLMAMVKAASYGAGKVEIANALQFYHVDYLTVAYADEGVELRRNGISLPIMVMNPEEDSFYDIIKYHLEPDIYSFRILNSFASAAQLFSSSLSPLPVHVEFDTGMHRLGFDGSDVAHLADVFLAPNFPLRVTSIFSHLACSEDPDMDAFTRSQIDKFSLWSNDLRRRLNDPSICRHILNSSGIIRFPDAQFDMVRLGIGLYGIAPQSDVQDALLPVSRLKTRISQIKLIPSGDSVGYNRRWIASRPSRIAILPIGYADGLNRHLGFSNGRVLVNDQQAPIIGSICMDMCFIDVSDIPCSEGDDVVIFGDARLLQQISAAADTIPYEILTSVSSRVKRIYFSQE